MLDGSKYVPHAGPKLPGDDLMDNNNTYLCNRLLEYGLEAELMWHPEFKPGDHRFQVVKCNGILAGFDVTGYAVELPLFPKDGEEGEFGYLRIDRYKINGCDEDFTIFGLQAEPELIVEFFRYTQADFRGKLVYSRGNWRARRRSIKGLVRVCNIEAGEYRYFKTDAEAITFINAQVEK